MKYRSYRKDCQFCKHCREARGKMRCSHMKKKFDGHKGNWGWIECNLESYPLKQGITEQDVFYESEEGRKQRVVGINKIIDI